MLKSCAIRSTFRLCYSTTSHTASTRGTEALHVFGMPTVSPRFDDQAVSKTNARGNFKVGRPRVNHETHSQVNATNGGQLPTLLGLESHVRPRHLDTMESAPVSSTTTASENLVDLHPIRRYRGDHACHPFLRIVGTTQSPAEAWHAYRALLDIPSDQIAPVDKPWIVIGHLHRLSHLLMRTKMKSRFLFLRHLSVLKSIRRAGGKVHLDEWNALIRNAGRGWRKIRLEDYKIASEIFEDMVSHRIPGSKISTDEQKTRPSHPRIHLARPDIRTYTNLIAIAARTSSPSALRHAVSLLKASGIPPNRVTHLAMLKYFTQARDLTGFRSTLSKMKEQGLELGLDGINTCLWFFHRNGRTGLASMIYRVLRHNVVPGETTEDHDIDGIVEYLANIQGIVMSAAMIPNHVTYTMMIQMLAYEGQFKPCMDVFTDMLSTKNVEEGAPRVPDEDGVSQPTDYTPTLAIFRALFLGFARHTIPPPSIRAKLSGRLVTQRQPSDWTTSDLEAIFELFLDLPPNTRRCRNTLYWIITAFVRASGNDKATLREVWQRLEEKYPWPWAASLNRLSRLREEIIGS